MLEVRELRKSFGNNEVIKGIDLDVNDGEVVAVIGPSGSGKTTMLRCISFLEKADHGMIRLDEHQSDMVTISKKQIHEMRMHMGFVFQAFNLFANKTALGNVMAPLTIARRMNTGRAREMAMGLLKKVGMDQRARYYPGQLSGGQQQRVAIARALASGPSVVLFDEPTSALDPELAGEVLDVMKQLAAEGTTMVVVTHEMQFAREAANKVVFMDNGVIWEQGEAGAFFEQPKTERALQFLRKQ